VSGKAQFRVVLTIQRLPPAHELGSSTAISVSSIFYFETNPL